MSETSESTSTIKPAANSDLGPEAWDARYAAADIPWDIGAVSPPLVHFHLDGALPKERRVLVPGCGSGYEIAFLADAGYLAVGVDFSRAAIVAAQRTIENRSGAQAFLADLLAPGGFSFGPFDWAFDQTFFCAIVPARRVGYAGAMARLIRPGGEIWALSFRVPPAGGPPFDSTPEEYSELMQGSGFELVERRLLEAESHPARRGRETLVRMRRV